MDINNKDGTYNQEIPLQPRFRSINNDFILYPVRAPRKCDDVNIIRY